MPRISNPQNFKGENLISKEALGLKSDEVLVVSGATAENKVIAAEFLPEVTVKETNASGVVQTVSRPMGPVINFIGNCGVRQNSDGSLTIRIGDNLNSSNFMTNDGQTKGVDNVTVTYPTNKKLGRLSNQTAISGATTGNYSLDTTTASGLIHIDNAVSTYFLLDYTAEGVATQLKFGPITMENADGTLKSSANFAATTSGTTSGIASACLLKLTNFDFETETAKGATGYCGNIKFDLPISGLAFANSTIKLTSLKYVNGTEGTFEDADLNAAQIFYYTDTTTKPAAGAVSYSNVTFNKEATKSGITYATSGTVDVTATALTNLFNPLGVSNNVSFTSTFAADKTVSTTSNVATTKMTLKDCTTASPIVTANPSNINGTGTSKDSDNNYGKGIIVYTGSIDPSIDEKNSTTQGRIKVISGDSGLSAVLWNSEDKLGTTDLQLYNGAITYPTQNFTGFNGKNSDRNYSTSTLGSGNKVYYVKLPYGGWTQQPKLTIVGKGLDSTSLKSVCVAPTLADLDSCEVLIENSSINAGYVTDTATSKVINLSYLGPGLAIDTAGAYAKIVMSGTGATITKISF